MKLSDNEVHVWYFKIDDFSTETALYASVLSEDEWVKVHKFKFAKDRTVHILSRGLLRILSGYYIGRPPKEVTFNYGEHGKPAYGFSTSLKFNVSHSERFIVVAFAGNVQIGVDVERIKKNFDVLNIAQNFFSPEEIETLRATPENDRFMAFYRCWTRKEAFIKAKGSGLSFPLASFTVSLDEGLPTLLKTEWDPQEKLEWQLFSFRPHTDYIGALSLRGKAKKISFYNFDSLKTLKDRI